MAKKIGDTLRESRINAGISVEQISDILTQKGYKASIKTIYSWENGNSSPGPDALLEMCDIYKIGDILSTFGYDGYKEDGSLKLNLKENQLIKKYRSLDPHGQQTVNIVLDRELDRTGQLLEAQNRITELESQASKLTELQSKIQKDKSYLRPVAAHERTDIEVTDEMRKADDDLMNNDDFWK